jgi:hypothetical protein
VTGSQSALTQSEITAGTVEEDAGAAEFGLDVSARGARKVRAMDIEAVVAARHRVRGEAEQRTFDPSIERAEDGKLDELVNGPVVENALALRGQHFARNPVGPAGKPGSRRAAGVRKAVRRGLETSPNGELTELAVDRLAAVNAEVVLGVRLGVGELHGFGRAERVGRCGERDVGQRLHG